MTLNRYKSDIEMGYSLYIGDLRQKGQLVILIIGRRDDADPFHPDGGLKLILNLSTIAVQFYVVATKLIPKHVSLIQI